jgi:hypothetical protein
VVAKQHEKEYLKNGTKSKGNTAHALSTALPGFHRRVHDLVEPSHLRLEPRHSHSLRRTRRKVEFTSAVLFEIICQQIFLVIVQSIQEREKMCLVAQHQLGGDDRSIGRLANDERCGIIKCLDVNDGGKCCIVQMYATTRLTAINVCFRRGSSSSSTSVGSLKMNLPSAINPNACDPALTPTSNAGSVRKLRRLLCIVVKPYTGSMREHSASRIVLVASRTWCHISDRKGDRRGGEPTSIALQYRTLNSAEKSSPSLPSRKAAWFPRISHTTIKAYSNCSASYQIMTIENTSWGN